MNLTKTQQQLIAEARRRGGLFSVSRVQGRGAQGGKINYGSRQRDALFGLEKLGMVRIVDRQSDTDYNRGYAVTCTSWAFELTA